MNMTLLAALLAMAISGPALAANSCSKAKVAGEQVVASTNAIALSDVQRCAASFVQSYYNITPATATGAKDQALVVMSGKLRETQAAPLDEQATQSVQQEITQRFVIDSGLNIKTDADSGYHVEFRGTRTRSTLNTVFSAKKYAVKLLIRTVQPSPTQDWAMVVDEITASEI
ncbi:hypothetical protein F2S72_01780 [Pseudomonas syringae pv. actinidiae]|nr:hypothetical protein [Pseudomonas syringae pv. actinidiae]